MMTEKMILSTADLLWVKILFFINVLILKKTTEDVIDNFEINVHKY